MRPALHTPAPSSTLLKFLKSQSESICFFSANPRPGFIFDHAAPRGPALRSQIIKPSSKSSARCLSTTTARPATVEAGFVNLDFLWPRSANKLLQSKSAQCRSTARAKKLSYENVLPAARAASTGWHNWHEKVWGRKKKGPKPLQPDDLPDSFYPRDDGGDSMFSLGRHISAKAAAQLSKVRCTELDENGNVVLASGEFKKSELIAKVRRSSHTIRAVQILTTL
jgi:magnesium transporter